MAAAEHTRRMPQRIRLIDVAKGMSITLVAFGHSHLVAMSPEAAALNRVFGLFRMPFFFFMSGLFFPAAKPLGTLLRDKSDALLKPYFVTLGLVVLVRVCLDGASLFGQLARILYGVGTAIDMPWAPMWYLAHLWLVFPYARGLVWLRTATGLPAWAAAGLLGLHTVLGFSYIGLFKNVPIALGDMQTPLDGLPFSLDLLAISTTYFLLGYALRDRVERFRPSPGLVATLLVAVVGLNVAFHPQLDLNQRTDLHPLATTACSFAGIYVALSAAYAVNRSERLAAFFGFLGFNSLFVVIFHAYFDELARRLVCWVMSWQAGRGTAAVAFGVAVVSSAALGAVIRRTPVLAALYLPPKARRATQTGDEPAYGTLRADRRAHRGAA